jgi:hypothetical protein
MKSCIYTQPTGLCDGGSPFSAEHWFSRGFGNFHGFVELKDKICRTCNNKFGNELEAVLLRASPEALFRVLAGGCLGRPSHDKVDIFSRATNKHPPVEVTGEDPDAKRILHWEVGPDSAAKPQRQILLIGPRGEVENVLLGSDLHFSEGVADRLRQMHEAGYRPERFNGDSSEDLRQINDLCTRIFGERQVAFVTEPAGSVVQAQSYFDLTPTYFRALAKIGFHSFLHFYPHLTGFESQFDAIKRFIYIGDEPNRFVFASPDVVVRTSDYEGPVHAIACDLNQDWYETRIQPFVGLESRMSVVAGTLGGAHINARQGELVWVVRVGRNPSILVFEDRRGAVFRYFRERQGGFHGEIMTLPSGKSLPIAKLLNP